MSITNALKKITWRQAKYELPALLYIPILFVGYFVISLFNTEKAEIPDSSLTTTEYLNPDLPDAKVKNDGIGSKYESMMKSYGKIDDYSAMESIDRENEQDKESYDSKYTDEERQMLESQESEKLSEMERQLQESAQKGQEIAKGQGINEYESRRREQEAMDELNRALAQARLQGQMSISTQLNDDDSGNNGKDNESLEKHMEGKLEINERSVKSKTGEDEPQEVVKKVKVSSDYFNTLSQNEAEPNTIKAIIDENIKAVDGSRVRLRLLDDIEIGETIIPKGTYLYALMSGFGNQRVRGTIKSIMIDDELIRVNLSIYDTDGMEGLYVPGSNFRETTKDIASGAMNNTSTLANGNTNNTTSLSQWGTQAITNAVQKTSNAISKAVKKNSVKLKYGTQVYLINGREKKN